ncbi:MAG TPA: DUF72 domain-containing protein [Flavitalea sp.]|nr:DUF72 domain-containing protein [Flavitalea sp.]
MTVSTFYAGTSGLLLPVANKMAYPPEFRDSSRLQFYSALFNSIEINSTFRKIPMQRTVDRWTREVTGDFRFTFKMPEAISHAKGLNYPPAILMRFLEVIAHADTHAGCVLLQFPQSFKAEDPDAVYTLLSQIRDNISRRWDLAVEFRDISWYRKPVIQQMKRYRAMYVTHDWHATKHELPEIITGSAIYLRFHGPERGYRGSYDASVLAQHAARIKQWLKKKYTVYVYFNNTLGEAIQNLQLLQSLVNEDN